MNLYQIEYQVAPTKEIETKTFTESDSIHVLDFLYMNDVQEKNFYFLIDENPICQKVLSITMYLIETESGDYHDVFIGHNFIVPGTPGRKPVMYETYSDMAHSYRCKNVDSLVESLIGKEYFEDHVCEFVYSNGFSAREVLIGKLTSLHQLSYEEIKELINLDEWE